MNQALSSKHHLPPDAFHCFVGIAIRCVHSNSRVRQPTSPLRSSLSPDVVVSAQDHAALRVARGTNFTQLSLAAGALQAPAVPIAIHGIEQEAVSNLPPAARTSFPREGATGDRGRLRAAAWVHHGLCK